MLSRIADATYWMSRYLERTGNTARMIEINLTHIVESEESFTEENLWRPMLAICSDEEGYAERYPDGEVTARRVMNHMTNERSNFNSIRSSLKLARENARVVRDRISKEMWEVMNEFWLDIDTRLKKPLTPEKAGDFFADVRRQVALFHGVTGNTMVRGEEFDFYLLGSFVERADMTTRILDVKYHLLLPDPSLVGSPLDFYQWAALLKTVSGYEAFRRRYAWGLRPIDVAEFIIFEPSFPRSIRFAVNTMKEAAVSVAGGKNDRLATALSHLDKQLELATPTYVFEEGLHEFTQRLLRRIEAVHHAVSTEFFEITLEN